jgi:hypothetical protein
MVTLEPVSAGALKEKLKKEKVIEISKMAFRIRKVPLLLLAEESDDLWELARQGQEVLTQKIKTLLASPTLPRMRRILLKGLVAPQISEMEDDESVPVDLLLVDYHLSSSLYIAIVNLSLEN